MNKIEYITGLRDIISDELVDNFINYVYNSKWNSGIPGGFLTNSPMRYVNTYGNGAGIDVNGKLSETGWPLTAWTATIKQNNISLYSVPEKMPESCSAIVPFLRALFYERYRDAKITNYTFNIAVCNYYTDPSMNIAPHTDDNEWYPSDSDQFGPIFASITLYPFNKPTSPEQYARFQIYVDNKWVSVNLPHESVFIMPSSIKHRVLPHLKKHEKNFCPRINITFRSTYPLEHHPLLNAMAVANHCRYYKMPSKLSDTINIDAEKMIMVYDAYNKYHKENNASDIMSDYFLTSEQRKYFKTKFKNQYNEYIKQYGYPPMKFKSNICIELMYIITLYLNPKKITQ